jgi:23S rRNA (pseudouridine1915-N3)-methyltransferase
MFHLTIISVGKLKEPYWRSAEAEYLKRLSAWVKIKIIELKEESFTDKDNPETVKAKEAKKIIPILPKNAFLVILTPEGKQFTSEKLAQQFNNGTMKQWNNIIFVIGGPLGLDKSILKMADLQLSLSPLTFTHQMSRIILLEQIYRSFTILSNKRYHY